MVIVVSLAWAFAAAQGSIVVDVWHFVAHLPTVVSFTISA